MLNPFMSSVTVWASLFPVAGCLVLIITIFIEIPVVNGNSVDPDQMPHLLMVNFYTCLFQ